MTTLDPIYKKLQEDGKYVFTRDTYTDEQAYIYLVAARSKMLQSLPFFGVCSLNLILVETKLIGTLAVDGYHFFYNPDFVKRLKRPGEIIFGFGHEVLHCILKHVGYVGQQRQGSRNDQLWGIAIDHVVNLMLVEAKCGDKITTIDICCNEKYTGWSAEQVYDDLEKNTTKVTIKIGSGKGNGQGDGEGGSFDMHIMVSPAEGSDGKPGATLPKEIAEKIAQNWTEIVQQAATAQHAAEQAGKAAGNIPAGLKQYIDSLVEPRVDWRDMLRHFVTQIITYDYSYSRPNKALFNDGWTMPGFRNYDDMIDIVFVADASGSMWTKEDLTAALSELKGICEAFVSYRVRYWAFDTKVYEDTYSEITPESDVGFEPHKTLPSIEGGGGTMFECNWDFMKEREIRPRLMVMFTDGIPGGSWGDSEYCPTLFLIKGTKNVAPFGITCFYDAPNRA